jgi:membrane protein
MAEESRPRDASGRSRLAALNERLRRFEQSAAGRYWRHLSTADFMNSSFAFAALAVLSAFPFLAVSSTVVGGDIRKAIVARMGLNAQATHDVDGLIATGNQAVAALTWVSAFVAVLGAIGMASTLQSWYLRIYEQPPQKGFARRLLYQSAGVVAFTLYISFEVWLFDQVRPFGGPGLIFLLTFVLAVLFWWWSTYMLLYRRVPFRQLFPAGVATGFCITIWAPSSGGCGTSGRPSARHVSTKPRSSSRRTRSSIRRVTDSHRCPAGSSRLLVRTHSCPRRRC